MLNAKLTSTERCPGRTLNRILVPPSPLPFSFPFPSTPQPFSTPTWGQLLRSPIVIPPTYHLSSPSHFEQMERQKGQRRSRRGLGRKRRGRGSSKTSSRKMAEGKRITSDSARCISMNLKLFARRFNTNRPCSTHPTCIKFPWNGRMGMEKVGPGSNK